jgi:hypothetical protein
VDGGIVHPQSLRWKSLSWTPWLRFVDLTAPRGGLLIAPWLDPEWRNGPGVYRFRSPQGSGLFYIGETLHMSKRFREHRHGTNRGRGLLTPQARRLAGLHQRIGTQLDRGAPIEVSWSSWPDVTKGELRALDVDLIALDDETVERPPTWQFLRQFPPEDALARSRRQAGRWLDRVGHS